MILSPPLTAPSHLSSALRDRGWAVLSAQSLCELAGVPRSELARLSSSWDALPPDPHLRDGGSYRFRRHACFVVDDGVITLAPRRAHWQPVEYNALHGGFERWFAPMEDATLEAPAWTALLSSLSKKLGEIAGARRWYVEAHQFRIDTASGIGRPTPEGAHRDGVDHVAVILVSRRGVKGGETRVFQATGPGGFRFTITDPWTCLLLDDERVIHETTPIQPTEPGGVRDTLVLTFRKQGFQGPAEVASDDRATPPDGDID